MTAEEYRRMLEDDAREEGIKEGIQTGIQQGRLEMLIKFLQNGTKEEAQRLLGATEEEIEKALLLAAENRNTSMKNTERTSRQ